MTDDRQEKPTRRGGFGRLLSGALDIVAPKVEEPEEETSGPSPPKDRRGASSPPAAVVQDMTTKRPSMAEVDPTFAAEVQKGIEERAPSDVLTTFLDQLRELEADPDYRDERMRYKTALKIAARTTGRESSDVLHEITQALGDRMTAVTQERTLGETELQTAETTQLAETQQRLTQIRAQVRDIREQIGRLQEEEGGLAQREAEVKRSTATARNKLIAACDHWTLVLSTVNSKVTNFLIPPAAAKPKED